jgi:cell division protein FtsL
MNPKRYSVHKWLMLLLLPGLLAAAQVGMAHKRLELARQHDAVQHEVRSLHAEISRLTLEFATLSRPERLRRLAVAELGMRPPTPMQVIRP